MNQSIPDLQELVGQPLRSGFKVADCELYHLGFGDEVWFTSKLTGETIPTDQYVLHMLWEIAVFRKADRELISLFECDTPPEEFAPFVEKMLGSTVKRAKILPKHHYLLLDFGETIVILRTDEDGGESWRFFRGGDNSAHMVATCDGIEIE